MEDDVEEEKRIPRPGSTLCASLHSRNAHGRLRRAICVEIYGEKAGRV